MSNQMYRKTIVFVFCCLFFISAAFAMGEKPGKTNSLDFTLKDLNGKAHSLSDYKGKYVFLNFGGTWCSPCRNEMPSMQKLYNNWDKNEYMMLVVNVGESADKVRSFARKNGYTFPILIDRNSEVAKKYGVRGVPATFFIGKDGKVVGEIVGSRHWDLEMIKRAFKK